MATVYRALDPRHGRSVAAKVLNRTWLSTDPDLDSIRGDPRVITLLATLPPERAELTLDR
jgi:hypothetical protein